MESIESGTITAISNMTALGVLALFLFAQVFVAWRFAPLAGALIKSYRELQAENTKTPANNGGYK